MQQFYGETSSSRLHSALSRGSFSTRPMRRAKALRSESDMLPSKLTGRGVGLTIKVIRFSVLDREESSPRPRDQEVIKIFRCESIQLYIFQ